MEIKASKVYLEWQERKGSEREENFEILHHLGEGVKLLWILSELDIGLNVRVDARHRCKEGKSRPVPLSPS
jgi:hypothetical protein